MKLPETLEFGENVSGAVAGVGDYHWRVVTTNLPDVSIRKGTHYEGRIAHVWDKEWRVYFGDMNGIKHGNVFYNLEHGDLRQCKRYVKGLFDLLKKHDCDFGACTECEKHNKCVKEFWYWRDAQQCNHDCTDCCGSALCNERERYEEWEAQF